jgi:hypothetical protein
MFSHTSSILADDGSVPFADRACTGNKMIHLLIGSWVDGYFQHTIKQLDGRVDKASALIKLQCASMNALDKDHFHHIFTSISIKENESAKNYLQCFI